MVYQYVGVKQFIFSVLTFFTICIVVMLVATNLQPVKHYPIAEAVILAMYTLLLWQAFTVYRLKSFSTLHSLCVVILPVFSIFLMLLISTYTDKTVLNWLDPRAVKLMPISHPYYTDYLRVVRIVSIFTGYAVLTGICSRLFLKLKSLPK